MATLLWQRDLGSDVAGVKNTYSSWDSCMTKSYCKWPAIIGIIIGSLIVLSVLFCLFRCLCCGLECCCGCLSCCNSCCPSPRKRNQGYEQAPPPPQQHQQYPQYQSHPPPMYNGGGYGQPNGFAASGYRGPQTATFEVPSKKKNGNRPSYNEDALPAMPSWDNAVNRHVEEDEVEMEKLDSHSAQQEGLLAQSDNGRYYGNQQETHTNGDLGAMHAGPYHDYERHQQFVGSPVSTAPPSMYPPTYHTSPPSTTYAPSIPPSYHTRPSSIASPPPQQYAGIGRKPVQGTWRDV